MMRLYQNIVVTPFTASLRLHTCGTFHAHKFSAVGTQVLCPPATSIVGILCNSDLLLFMSFTRSFMSLGVKSPHASGIRHRTHIGVRDSLKLSERGR